MHLHGTKVHDVYSEIVYSGTWTYTQSALCMQWTITKYCMFWLLHIMCYAAFFLAIIRQLCL